MERQDRGFMTGDLSFFIYLDFVFLHFYIEQSKLLESLQQASRIDLCGV